MSLECKSSEISSEEGYDPIKADFYKADDIIRNIELELSATEKFKIVCKDGTVLVDRGLVERCELLRNFVEEFEVGQALHMPKFTVNEVSAFNITDYVVQYMDLTRYYTSSFRTESAERIMSFRTESAERLMSAFMVGDFFGYEHQTQILRAIICIIP